MAAPLQRERLLKLFQEHADSRGRVHLSVKEIFELTGIPLHDVAKTAWGLQKEQKLRFRESKRGGAKSGGRTKSSLSDFQLLPSAWTEEMRNRQDARRVHNREQFEALVASMSKPKDEELPPVESPKDPFASTNNDNVVEGLGWGRVRMNNGSIRRGEVLSLDNGKGAAVIRDVSGHLRYGKLVERFDTRPQHWPTIKRKIGRKTYLSSPAQETDLGWARIDIGNNQTARGKLDRINPATGKARILDAAGRERYGFVIERYDSRPADWPTKRQIHRPTKKKFSFEVEAQPTTETQQQIEAKPQASIDHVVISRSEFPLIARALERDDNLLAAAESLKKAGLDEEAERVLSANLFESLSPLERELDRFLRKLKARVEDNI